MNGSLLDTNVVIKCIRGDADAGELLEKLDGPMLLSAVVVGELLYGAYKSVRKAENIALFSAFVHDHTVLPVDEPVSDAYGKIKAELSNQGVNIPENDMWIAATAIVNGLTLATFDAHFKHIGGLHILP